MTTSSFATTARSVVGLVRSGNEDSALLHPNLIAVADGMGGHAAGEVASAIAIKTLSRLAPVLEKGDIDPDAIQDLMLNALQEVDFEIGRVAREDLNFAGMGTTLSALMLYGTSTGPKVALVHVGDSRAYRLRDETLTLLSHDHTVLQELLDLGSVTPEEASVHPKRSFLTQALMGDGPVAPVLMVYDVEPNDRFLLCSDGLSSAIDEEQITGELQIPAREDVVDHLIAAAYAAGAPDNVTVLVADIAEEPEPAALLFIGSAS